MCLVCVCTMFHVMGSSICSRSHSLVFLIFGFRTKSEIRKACVTVPFPFFKCGTNAKGVFVVSTTEDHGVGNLLFSLCFRFMFG